MTDKEIERFVTFCQETLRFVLTGGFSIEHKYIEKLLGRKNYTWRCGIEVLRQKMEEKGMDLKTKYDGTEYTFYVARQKEYRKMTKEYFDAAIRHLLRRELEKEND